MRSSAYRHSISGWLVACALAAASWSSPAFAEDALSAQRSKDASSEARAHFERGLALAQGGEFEQAITQFELAYAASPNFSVLFNLGQAYGAAGRAVSAERALQHYLELGGTAIEAEQRRRASDLISYYQRRIGRIAVSGLPSGAQLSLDGEVQGVAPLEAAIEAGVGRRVLSIRAKGYEPLVRTVDVKAGEQVSVTIALTANTSGVVAAACAKPSLPNCEAALSNARSARAKTQKLVALAVGGGAVLLGGTAITLAILNRSRYAEWRQRDEAFTSAFARDPSTTSLDQLEALLRDENSIRNRDSLALGLGVAAGTLAVSSLALYLSAAREVPTLSVGPRGELRIGYRASF